MDAKKCPDLHERAKRIHEPGRVCRELLYLRSKRVSKDQDGKIGLLKLC